jgi:rfaE bifunctional protein nucleotidyltransferase chain/domain
MMPFYPTGDKIIPYRELSSWRKSIGVTEPEYKNGPFDTELVVTNGCFDVLHVGHVEYLEEARAQGDKLLVGVNNDDSVRWLKGKGRPINCALYRARVLAALECVDYVTIFPSLVQGNAADFLKKARPVVYVKGGDYSLDTLNEQESTVLQKYKSNIYFSKLIEGVSTTKLLDNNL